MSFKREISAELQIQEEEILTTDLEDEKKRWLTVGFCLFSIISPLLRKYVDSIVSNLYSCLVSSDSIDTQGYNQHLKIFPGTQICLNYKSINNNRDKNYRNYDYKVKSHVDLSKLFLEPYSTDYTAFDESCDSSALLAMIINISSFPQAVRTVAEKIQSDIRRPWAHCDLKEWTIAKYTDSFQLMEQLIIKVLDLHNTERKRKLEELSTLPTNANGLLSETYTIKEVYKILQKALVLIDHLESLSIEKDSQIIQVIDELKEQENFFKEWIKYVESRMFSKEKMNMANLGQIVLDILADALYDLLKLDTHGDPINEIGLRSQWNITSLYQKHRYLNKHTPRESNNREGHWGGSWSDLAVSDIGIGDDIERIRLVRNELQHSSSYAVVDSKKKKLCTIVRDVLHRFDLHNPSHLYEDRFNKILQNSSEIEDAFRMMFIPNFKGKQE